MKKHLSALITLAAVLTFAVSAAQAGEGVNFVSGNKNNDGKYTPRKVRQMAAKDPNRKPGFWDKEWKRSGLDQTIGGAWWSPIAKSGDYLKQKEDAYRAKHPAGADVSVS